MAERLVHECADRFFTKVHPGDGGCWLWGGHAVLSNGVLPYGRFTLREGVWKQAHRFAYELLVGPIPEGLVLDHLCRNTLCVNPMHLEPVTPAENNRRGNGVCAKNARKTHCKHGHSFSGDNLGVKPTGTRYCKECYRKYQRDWKRDHYVKKGGE